VNKKGYEVKAAIRYSEAFKLVAVRELESGDEGLTGGGD
jgi:hypothetical protein